MPRARRRRLARHGKSDRKFRRELGSLVHIGSLLAEGPMIPPAAIPLSVLLFGRSRQETARALERLLAG